MRSNENFTPHILAAFLLTLGILAAFQVYLWKEPLRIQQNEVQDRQATVQEGKKSFAEACTSCHGLRGQGGIGPALNSKEFLKTTSNELVFSLIRTGVPGTPMPAWGQAFGGPFTDEQAMQVTAFIRSWEPTAPQIVKAAATPDPVRGAAIFSETCSICHGKNGVGTVHAPALNDPKRLSALDDTWYRNTIAHGRPAKGMPTWGTVLSPAEINDVVALISAWRVGKTIVPNVSITSLLTNALFAIRDFDIPDTLFYLKAAQAAGQTEEAGKIQTIIPLVEKNHLFEAQSLLVALLPPEEMGKATFSANCAACHGSDGTGGIGPNLHANSFVKSKTADELVQFVLAGRKGTPMDGFKGILGEEEIRNVVTLIMGWQK